MALTRRIDNALYSRKALAAAREAYAQYCSVRATPQSDGLVDVTVDVKAEYAQESRQVTLEFWNYLLDTACQQRIESA
jgi:hypothetical protein